ncbi:unnamed protein product [Plutella xylostella]|uniref:(diamondback moth) hypothetical protein n=1 Tax=Plutella xylostella TaxID=51655 RepID=A0A8S4FZQ1_PLUXY|nr:unnamed protein product [Plutella xylostella]
MLSEVLVLILEKWSPSIVEKQQQVVRDAIRRAAVDADCNCRTHARKAYFAYIRMFPEDAEALFLRLDSAAQKQIDRERHMASADCLHTVANDRRILTSPRSPSVSVSDRSPAPTAGRSVSALDAAAAQRARARAMYSHMGRAKLHSNTASLRE